MAGTILSQGAITRESGANYTETNILVSKQNDAVFVVFLSTINVWNALSATLGGVALRRASDGTSVAGLLPTTFAGGPQLQAYYLPLSQLDSSGKKTLAISRDNSPDMLVKWFVVGGVVAEPRVVHNQTGAAATSLSIDLSQKEENDFVLQCVAKKDDNTTNLLVSSPFKNDGTGIEPFDGVGHHMCAYGHYGGEPPDVVTWSHNTATQWNTATLFFSSSTPNALTEETQHFEDGLRSLAGPFWGKPRIAALLRSYLRRTQEEEAVYWQVLRAFHPETATGVALELLGKIVGQPKLGFTEDEHRALIRGRIRTNRSFGGHQDLLEIIQAVALTTAPTHIYQLPFMTVYVVPEERLKESEAAAMLVLLPDGRAAGVRMFVMLAYETASEPYDYSDLGLLFSDSVDPSTTPGAAWFDTRQV